MFGRKILNLVVLISMFASLLVVGGASPAMADNVQAPSAANTSSVTAAPISPTDQTKVPHYFGPWPNWANSAYTLPDANVTITGDGSGATAVATVGGNGAVTDITITNPGSGYTAATVDISPTLGTGAGAAAMPRSQPQARSRPSTLTPAAQDIPPPGHGLGWGDDHPGHGDRLWRRRCDHTGYSGRGLYDAHRRLRPAR